MKKNVSLALFSNMRINVENKGAGSIGPSNAPAEIQPAPSLPKVATRKSFGFWAINRLRRLSLSWLIRFRRHFSGFAPPLMNSDGWVMITIGEISKDLADHKSASISVAELAVIASKRGLRQLPIEKVA